MMVGKSSKEFKKMISDFEKMLEAPEFSLPEQMKISQIDLSPEKPNGIDLTELGKNYGRVQNVGRVKRTRPIYSPAKQRPYLEAVL